LETLQRESAAHRVLILRRGAVVAVTTLLAIGGAFFLHFLFAGLFLLGLYFGQHRAGLADGGSGNGPDPGGSGYMILGDEALDARPAPPARLGLAEGTGLAAVPAIPALPASLVPPPAAPEEPAADRVRLAQVAIPDDLGKVKVTPPRFALPNDPPPPQALSIAPPAPPAEDLRSATAAPPQPGTGANGKSPAAVRRGSLDGDLFGEESGEPIFSIVKGDGEGQGAGHARGLDRGLSAANAEPQLLIAPAFDTPLVYQIKPPAKSLRLLITVRADGSIGPISIEQSSGVAALDDQIRDHVLSTFHFRPAFQRGRPVESQFMFIQSFRDGD
jgi:hypothetical protein